MRDSGWGSVHELLCARWTIVVQWVEECPDSAEPLWLSNPVALVESVSDAVLQRYKVRRLHSVIDDLWLGK